MNNEEVWIITKCTCKELCSQHYKNQKELPKKEYDNTN